jgi:hypothetical protein
MSTTRCCPTNTLNGLPHPQIRKPMCPAKPRKEPSFCSLVAAKNSAAKYDATTEPSGYTTSLPAPSLQWAGEGNMRGMGGAP